MNGCDFIVAKHRGKFQKGGYSERCGKLRQEGSDFCPKHTLMTAEAEHDADRRKEHNRRRKEARAAQMGMIAIEKPKASRSYEK